MHPPQKTLAWLPQGLAAIDSPETLFALDAQIAGGALAPRAGDDLDDWDRWVSGKAEKRVGLKVSKELGIAVQPVAGVLIHGASLLWEAFYGVVNTARIGQAAAYVAATPRIKALILDFNTPGGYVTGIAEAAEALQNLPSVRKDVAVLGWVGGMCCSAGEWIAAGCQLKKAAPSATLGSVGIYNILVDSSRMFQTAGIDVHLFTDGQYKAMGMSGVPVPEAHKKLMRDRVMETSGEFKGYLRTRRPGITDEAMQGQTFTAKKAPVGFHDGTEFNSLEEFMAAVLS